MNKKIVFIIALCFLSNNLISPGLVEASVDLSSPVVQADVFQAVTFARLPFTVVNDLLQGIPLFPEYKQPARDQGQDKDNASQANKNSFSLNPTNEAGTSLKIDNKKALRTAKVAETKPLFPIYFSGWILLNR